MEHSDAHHDHAGMKNYRRSRIVADGYFFTVNLAGRA